MYMYLSETELLLWLAYSVKSKVIELSFIENFNAMAKTKTTNTLHAFVLQLCALWVWGKQREQHKKKLRPGLTRTDRQTDVPISLFITLFRSRSHALSCNVRARRALLAVKFVVAKKKFCAAKFFAICMEFGVDLYSWTWYGFDKIKNLTYIFFFLWTINFINLTI